MGGNENNAIKTTLSNVNSLMIYRSVVACKSHGPRSFYFVKQTAHDLNSIGHFPDRDRYKYLSHFILFTDHLQ